MQAIWCISPDIKKLMNVIPFKGSTLKGVRTVIVADIGTLKLHITDDNGTEYLKELPDRLWVPSISKTLAYPKHFAEDCLTTDWEKIVLVTEDKNLNLGLEQADKR